MEQITRLSINILKVHPQNIEFFDDIEGEQYIKFKKSIEEDGIITPLIVSPDMTIISGHQRYKACKDLGIELIPVIIREELLDEDEKLKKLLATNFGRLKNNPLKQGRVYSEYEKLCGVRTGSKNLKGVNVGDKMSLTQEQIAKELGVDVKTIQRLKKLQTLSPELQQLIEDGSVKYTTALNVYAKLTSEEQEQLISDLGKDYIATLTQKKAEEITNQYNERLKNAQNSMENMKLQGKREAENLLNSKIKELSNQIDILKSDKSLLEKKVNLNAKEAEDHRKLKAQLDFLNKQKDDLSRQIQSATELSGLSVKIDHLLKTELSPIKYSRTFECMDSEIARENLFAILDNVQNWCNEIRNMIPKEYRKIEVYNG